MTALEKYLLELNKQKQLAESRFNNLNSFQNQLLNSSYAWLLNNMNLQNGVFDVPGDLPGLMNGFVDNILKIADKSKNYEGALNNYITDLNTIKQNIDEFHFDYHEIAKNKPGVKDVQKAVITEVIDQYSENGLNRHFAQPLRELMFNNILGGMSQKEAKDYLQEYITGGKDNSGKLQQYLEQTAQQGVDSYTGAINMKLKKDFDFTGYIISGSLIDTSSKQCIYAIQTSEGGYLSFADWEKVLQIARDNKKAKLIEGTTVDNLPLNKLHRGCRHEFTPTIVAKDIKQPPKQAEPPKPAPKPAPAPKPRPEPKQQPKPLKTTPNSIKDVESEIVKTGYVKNADLSSLKLETAAKTTQVVEDIYSKLNLTPIELKSTKGKGTFRARANGGHIEVHGQNIEEKEEMAKRYLENKPRQVESLESSIATIRQRLETGKSDYSVQKHYSKELKKFETHLENVKGFKRWTVDKTIEGTIIHEFGHVIHDQRSGGINSSYYLKKEFQHSTGSYSNETLALNRDWKKIFQRVSKSPERFKVSEYALTKDTELFAECFTLYWTDKKNELPKGVETYIDNFLKALKK